MQGDDETLGQVAARAGPAHACGQALGMTHSVCPGCRSIVPAKVITDGADVFFRKFCPTCGESQAFVRADAEAYLAAQRYVKPAWRPRAFGGDCSRPCPDGCGFCQRHEQHLCMPIVEITSRCNLSCPACLVAAGLRPGGAGGPSDMGLDEFRRVLDALLAAEGQVDVLNLSGGEPFLHPRVLDFLDETAGRKEIVRVSISTNGLALLDEPALLAEIHRRGVVISLQFDGFSSRPYEQLRGRDLLDQKRRILDRLAEAGITTSLTMTLAAGVNEGDMPAVLDYLFAHRHVVSLMIQPLAYAGRGANLPGRQRRLTIPDVIRLLGAAGRPAASPISADDFAPLPCSHPLCFALAFYLMLDDGRPAAIKRLLPAGTLLDCLANRTVFGLDADEYQRLRELTYELWSGPAGSIPDAPAVLATLGAILREFSESSGSRGSSGAPCGCFDPRRAFALAERRVKSIFIHAFQDADTFDLARVRRCCNAYPQPDGTLVPACIHNVLRRDRYLPKEATP